MRFITLHVIAIALHTTCLTYSIFTPAAFTTAIPVSLRRVTYDGANGTDITDITDETSETNVYYQTISTLAFHIPSVILLHGIVALVTILFHAIVYIPVHRYMASTVWTQRHFAPRWLEYAITCTMMTIASATSAGNRDFNAVVSIALGGIALQAIGCCIEQSRSRRRTVFSLFAIGTLLNFASSWSTIWYLLSATSREYQWIEFVAYSFFYALFPLNCYLDTTKSRRDRFIVTDWIYNVLSLSSKFALFWLQVGEVEARLYPNELWPRVQIYVLGILFPLAMLGIGIRASPNPLDTALYTDQENKVAPFVSWLATARIVDQ